MMIKKVLTGSGKDAKLSSKRNTMEQKPIEPAPYAIHLGIEILEKTEGFARLRLPYRRELTNPAGKIHGGVIASVADTAMAVAVSSVLGGAGRHSTARLEIKYKTPVIDSELIAEGRVTQQKKKLFWGEAVLTNGNGQVVATATGTFMITDPNANPR
jgi:uncharacterized protein (TIGR00369 family)